MYLTQADHLLDGDVPKACRLVYLAAVSRAKQLLVDVDIVNINENLSNIAWMIDDIPENQTNNSSEDVEEDPEEQVTRLTFADLPPSPAQVLEKERHDIALDAGNALTWPQYFGVLALYMCNKAYLMEMLSSDSNFPDKYRPFLPNTFGKYASDAVEAASWGEALLEKERIQARFGEHVEVAVSRKRSLQASQAANQRHAKANQIKSGFIEYYFAGQFKNRLEAARQFFGTLSDEQKGSLAINGVMDNAVRTLTQALRSYAKARSSAD